MTTATKKKVTVKASKKTGKVNKVNRRNKASTAKPAADSITREEIENLVDEAIAANSFSTRAYEVSGSVFSGVLTGMLAIVDGVWEFCGKVYTTCRGALTAMYNWLSAQAKAATGQAKKAYEGLSELVGSMNVETISDGVVKLLATACAMGLAITVGAAVGVTMAGLATSLGAPAAVASVAAVLFAATTAVCVAEVVYAFSLAGLSDNMLAVSLAEAQAAQARADRHATTPAVACA